MKRFGRFIKQVYLSMFEGPAPYSLGGMLIVLSVIILGISVYTALVLSDMQMNRDWVTGLLATILAIFLVVTISISGLLVFEWVRKAWRLSK
jgi:hypothetical protein